MSFLNVILPMDWNPDVTEYIVQLLGLGVVVTPIFGIMFYLLYKYRNHIFFYKRGPLFTFAICLSMYCLILAETILSPQYTLLILTHDDIMSKYIYNFMGVACANVIALSAAARLVDYIIIFI